MHLDTTQEEAKYSKRSKKGKSAIDIIVKKLSQRDYLYILTSM